MSKERRKASPARPKPSVPDASAPGDVDPSLDPTEAFLIFMIQEAPSDDDEADRALIHHRRLKETLWWWEKGANCRSSTT